MPFAYKKVLLVGATSGIGEALAEKLVSEGVKLIVVGRRKEKLDEFVHKHGEGRAEAVVFDITKLSEIPNFVKEVTKSHPDLDCVFLNSGIQRGMNFTKPETIDLAAFDEEVATNYSSFVHLTVAFLPFLQKQGNPTSFIYTTSGLSLIPIVRCPNYCATKAALHHFILVLRQQMKDGPGDVKVVELFPPAVQTELHDADKQPDIKNGRQMGMPIDQFTSEAWEGLDAGLDQVAVGSAKNYFGFESWEQERQKMFHTIVNHMAEANKNFYAHSNS